MKMHQCHFCGYQSSRNYNLKVHVKNKHSNHNAPTNTHLQPEVVHSSTEIPQHVTGYQEPMKGSWITTQQFDPSSIPAIEVWKIYKLLQRMKTKEVSTGF